MGDAWEAKCLAQMDDEAIWLRIGRPKPAESEKLPRWVVSMIFRFNFAIFAGVLTVLLVVLAFTMSDSLSDFRNTADILSVVGFIVVVATAMAFYSANIYRRSWNRRAARFLNEG
jgi:polyferredoxin